MNALFEIEQKILLWIQTVRQPWLTPLMRVVTHLGDGGALWIGVTAILLIASLACRRRGWSRPALRTGVTCAMAMLLTLILVNLLIKPLAARVRPYDAIDRLTALVGRQKDFSFPSGHSANSLTCAWVLWRISPRRFGAPALALAVLIALSRLYVGVHYPTDVLCGALIGAALAEISVRLVRRIPALREK